MSRHLVSATPQRLSDELIVTMDIRQPLTGHEGDSLVEGHGGARLL
jgi:hypothetical protein